MITLIGESPVEVPSSRPDCRGDRVQAQIWSLLGSLYPHGKLIERRGEQRYPYPYLIQLTPVGKDGCPLEEEAIVVVGKNLSERGLGFYHPMPLSHRRVIVCLETLTGCKTGFLLDLTWCRFTQKGWYESGGRFLQVETRCQGPFSQNPALSSG